MDVVFTWVNGAWPGYSALLSEHSGHPRDLSPNRTRDNLDLLRYGLRALEAYLPELRRVFLFSMRPQVPAWLDTGHADLRVVHHDEVIAAKHLPTFNSFSIVSHLHLIPDLGEEFLYFEDDMLLSRGGAMAALGGMAGPAVVLRSGGQLKRRLGSGDPSKISPWNLALDQTVRALEARHGARTWPQSFHVPLRVNRDDFAETMERYAPEIEATRQARFRSGACVAPEVLYPLDALARGFAQPSPPNRPGRYGYASLENVLPWTALQLAGIDLANPVFTCLNDSFGAHPNPRAEGYVRRWLAARYPVPSRFERASAA